MSRSVDRGSWLCCPGAGPGSLIPAVCPGRGPGVPGPGCVVPRSGDRGSLAPAVCPGRLLCSPAHSPAPLPLPCPGAAEAAVPALPMARLPFSVLAKPDPILSPRDRRTDVTGDGIWRPGVFSTAGGVWCAKRLTKSTNKLQRAGRPAACSAQSLMPRTSQNCHLFPPPCKIHSCS